MQIKQFQIAEDINDLILDSNKEIIEKCDEKDNESIIHILNEYEKFKNEIEEKINIKWFFRIVVVNILFY